MKYVCKFMLLGALETSLEKLLVYTVIVAEPEAGRRQVAYRMRASRAGCREGCTVVAVERRALKRDPHLAGAPFRWHAAHAGAQPGAGHRADRQRCARFVRDSISSVLRIPLAARQRGAALRGLRQRRVMRAHREDRCAEREVRVGSVGHEFRHTHRRCGHKVAERQRRIRWSFGVPFRDRRSRVPVLGVGDGIRVGHHLQDQRAADEQLAGLAGADHVLQAALQLEARALQDQVIEASVHEAEAIRRRHECVGLRVEDVRVVELDDRAVGERVGAAGRIYVSRVMVVMV